MPRKPKVDPLFTDMTNEYGPVGNDTGADVLGHYIEWRKRKRLPEKFLPHILRVWQVPDRDWDDLEIGVVMRQLEDSAQSRFERLTRDDTIIALAFAQCGIDGVMQPLVRDRALKAIERQSHDAVINFRGWVDADLRRNSLEKMRIFLMAAPLAPLSYKQAGKRGTRNTLIVQFPADRLPPYDRVIEIENTLIQAFEQNGKAIVDGHDFRGTANIIIFPTGAWSRSIEIVMAYLKLREALGEVLVIKRLQSGAYRVIWPEAFDGQFERV